jgi:transcriptional/translational regulatory protein YebC/TACO1
MVPASWSELDPETSTTVMKLVDMLEDLDDVQNVYTNASYDESAWA